MNTLFSPVRPCALVICGVPASGKSTLAAAVSASLGWPTMSSDLVRKELAGIAPAERAGPGHYTGRFSQRVYTELGARAAARIQAGGSVIVDGTFRRRDDRAAFRAGLGAGPSVYAECRLSLPVLLSRAAARDTDPGRVSDATAAVAAREYGRWQPLDEVPAADRTVIDTIWPAAAAAADLAAWIPG